MRKIDAKMSALKRGKVEGSAGASGGEAGGPAPRIKSAPQPEGWPVIINVL